MYYLDDKWNGISRFIIISTAIHILIIATLMYISSIIPVKRFITPLYVVDIVEPLIEGQKKATVKPPKIDKPPVSPPVEKAVEKQVEVEPTSTHKEEEAVSLKKEAEVVKPDIVKAEEDKKVGVDVSIKMLEEKIKRKDEKETNIQEKIKEFESLAKIQQKVDELAQKTQKKEVTVKKAEKEEKKIEKKHVETEPPVSKVLEPIQPIPIPKIGGKITQEMIDLEFKAYYLKLREAIYSKWIFPNDSKKDMMTIISLKISRAGNLIERYLERTSGSPAFDNSAIRAVEKAAPFPPLPESFPDEFMEVGIRFCPYGCLDNGR